MRERMGVGLSVLIELVRRKYPESKDFMLADLLGVTNCTFSQLKHLAATGKGKRQVSVDFLQRVSKALGISLPEVVDILYLNKTTEELFGCRFQVPIKLLCAWDKERKKTQQPRH